MVSSLRRTPPPKDQCWTPSPIPRPSTSRCSLRPRQPGARPADAELDSSRAPARLRRSSAASSAWAAATGRRRPAARPRARAGHLRPTPPTADAADAIEAAAGRRAGLARAALRRPGRDLPAAADLLAGPWRETAQRGHHARPVQDRVPGRDRLGLRADRLLALQRRTSPGRSWPSSRSRRPGVWNRIDHRPLEGFVYAITPFNFTAIAGNLPTAPALMGNTVVWKPSPTQQLAAHLIMQLLEEAGLPPGVINMVTGDGLAVSEVALADPRLAGIHFTGSTAMFQQLWQPGRREHRGYRTYPRLVGETGGKDFVVAHPSADPDVLRTALVRGAFEYQGQKCSAASRAYVPRSVWAADARRLPGRGRRAELGRRHRPVELHGRGDRRPRRSTATRPRIDRAKADPRPEVVAGGTSDDSEGYFVRPTVLRRRRPDRRDLHAPSTSARSWPSTSTTTAELRRRCSTQVDQGSRRTR